MNLSNLISGLLAIMIGTTVMSCFTLIPIVPGHIKDYDTRLAYIREEGKTPKQTYGEYVKERLEVERIMR